MSGALTRFRVIAYTVGVGLLVLVLIGMPLQYLADNKIVVSIVGPIHGFLYMVYLVGAFDLARRAGWSLKRTVLIMLAGTIPFVSFVAERKATGWVRRGAPARPYAGRRRRLTGTPADNEADDETAASPENGGAAAVV